MNQVADTPINVTWSADHERQRLVERPPAGPTQAPSLDRDPRSRARPKWPALAVAFGLLFMAAAGASLVSRAHRTVKAPEAAAETFQTIGTSTTSYPPGHTSGWHVHPGVHSVVVLSGTLTVYDERCARTEYGPGQTYLGGSEAHAAHNESPDALDVAITFVYRPAADGHGTSVPAPAGCDKR